MRDDSVGVFQRLVKLRQDIKTNGATVEKVLQMATLALAIGNPDQALHWTNLVMTNPKSPPIAIREALWLAVLAECLKAAIHEGDAEGAPAYVPDREISSITHRKKAQAILEGLSDLTPDETMLLRKLKLQHSLGCIEVLIHGRNRNLRKQ